MQAWHQQNLLDPSFPFDLFFSENIQFPPHWHGEMELAYVTEGRVKVGVNSEIYTLEPRDILIVGSGEVHHFPQQTQPTRIVFIQFGLSFFDSYSTVLNDRRLTHPLFNHSGRLGVGDGNTRVHAAMEAQIQALIEEHRLKRDGYSIALKARLYDLFLLLLREVPMEQTSAEERRKQSNRLERLEKVFDYVESHLDRRITMTEAAREANFSVFHFTRFFKATTGMTFGEYLSNFRVKRAEWYLSSTEDSVTEIALKTGFNSIQSFDRVFKELKGCSPKAYRSAIFDKK